MKYSSWAAFEGYLEGVKTSRQFFNIMLVLGKDRFLRKRGEDQLKNAFLEGRKDASLIVKNFDIANLSLPLLLEEIGTISMFGDTKIILIEGELEEKLPKPLISAMETFCKNPSSNLYLILSISALNANTSFYKQIDKSGVIIEFPEEKGATKEKTLSSLIQAQVIAAGKEIETQASHFLLKQVSENPASLHQEVNKLLCFVGDRPRITLQDIKSICCNDNYETIWQLGDAIYRRDASNAFRICRLLLNEGTNFLGLLRQLRSQFQTGFQVLSILLTGGTPQDISQRFPYMKGFILDKNMQTAHNYGLNNYIRAMLVFDEVELKAKNSFGSEELLADVLITKLTQIKNHV